MYSDGQPKRRKRALEPPAAARRQPLLMTSAVTSSAAAVHCVDEQDDGGKIRRVSRIGETAGVCAAVCCCCPCAVVHLLILAVYRLPRCLWRKKKRGRPLRKKQMNSLVEEANLRKLKAFGFYDGDVVEESTEDEDRGGENDVVDWEIEMWDRFDGAGFWRSSSQRTDE